MPSLPVGIVTFLFTDIEGSTRLVQELGPDYLPVLELHGELMRSAITAAGGVVVSTEGDSFFAVFDSPVAAVAAATEAQRRLAATSWPSGIEVKVRMGLHTGEGILGGDNYAGLDVHRAARIAGAAHGGQIVVSAATAVLAGESLPPGVTMRDLGSHRLKDLANPEPLRQVVIEGLRSDFPPLQSLDAMPHNLPVQLTTFVGRPEVEAVMEAVRTARLVTLTGPGGTGKTRLSLQVAAELLGDFSGGVWFVALAAIREPDLVTPTVAATLGLQPSAEDPDQRLVEYLRNRELLLVLDNFEQVVEAADRVAGWMQGASKLKVLVSSRVPLHIAGELEYAVPPLPLPDLEGMFTPESLAEYESVQLFVQRAQAINPGFGLTVDNGRHVAEIVTRLDGLPLAIELAAARSKVLGPAALAERLHSRLALLTGGARDLPERQRTLRGAIEWSYDLLDSDHRRLFACLGAFSGSFGLAECEAICQPDVDLDVLDGLSNLVDHSLLRPLPSDHDPRFFMLETIGELAREHLEAADIGATVRHRHAEVYLALAEEGARHFTRRGQREWLDRIAVDHDNLRYGLSWAIAAEEIDLSLRFVAALWRYWQMRGWLQEGRRLADQVVAQPGGSEVHRLDALEAAGGLAYWQADADATFRYYRAALELAEKLGDQGRLADALYNLSSPEAVYGDPDNARALLKRATEIATALSDRVRQGTYEWGMGTSYFLGDNPQASIAHYDEALRLLEGTDAIFQIGWTYRMKATALLYLDQPEEAEPYLRQGLAIFAQAGDTSAFALHVRDYAELALARGDPEMALLLAGATAALEAASETRMLDFVANRLRDLEQAVVAVGEEKAEKLLARGQAMSVREILELVGYQMEQ